MSMNKQQLLVDMQSVLWNIENDLAKYKCGKHRKLAEYIKGSRKYYYDREVAERNLTPTPE